MTSETNKFTFENRKKSALMCISPISQYDVVEEMIARELFADAEMHGFMEEDAGADYATIYEADYEVWCRLDWNSKHMHYGDSYGYLEANYDHFSLPLKRKEIDDWHPVDPAYTYLLWELVEIGLPVIISEKYGCWLGIPVKYGFLQSEDLWWDYCMKQNLKSARKGEIFCLMPKRRVGRFSK